MATSHGQYVTAFVQTSIAEERKDYSTLRTLMGSTAVARAAGM